MKMINRYLFCCLCLCGLFVNDLTANCQVTIRHSEGSSSTSICAGASILLDAQLDATDTDCQDNFSYIWNTGETTSEIEVSPNSNMTYSVTITSNDDPSNTSSDEIDITVYAVPVISNISGPNSVCEEGVVALQAEMGGMGSFTYVWSSDDDMIASIQSSNMDIVTIEGEDEGGTTIFCIVTDANGCRDTSSVSFTVYENPSTVITGDSTHCAGAINVELCTMTNGGDGTYTTLNWTSSNIAVANVGGLGSCTSVVNLDSGTTTITYSVTDGNGCMASDSMFFQVFPNPTVNITHISSNCNTPSAVVLNGNPSGGSGNYTTTNWNTSPPGIVNILTGGTSSQVTLEVVATSGTATITFNVIDSNGCTAMGEYVIDAGNFEPPSINLTPMEPINLCIGESITFNGNATGGAGGYTYTWNNSIGGICSLSSNNTQTIICTATSQGETTITYTVTDANGCTVTDSRVVMVNPNPTADAGDDQITCLGSSVILGGDPTASGGTVTEDYDYQWSNGTTISNPPEEPPLSIMTYFVTITDDNYCTDIDTVETDVYIQPFVTLSGSSPSACLNDQVTLIAGFNSQLIPGTPMIEWQQQIGGSWIPANGTVISDSSFLTDPIVGDSYFRAILNYVDAGTVIAGCNENISDVYAITLVGTPMPEILSENDFFCENGTSLFYNPNKKDGSVHTWEVFASGGTPIITVLEDSTILLVQWGSTSGGFTYNISLNERVGTSGCEDDISTSITVSPGSAPDPAEIFFSPINNTLIYNDSTAECYQWGFYDRDTGIGLVTLDGSIPDTEIEDHQAFVVGMDYKDDRIYWCRAGCGDCTTTAVYRNGNFTNEGTIEEAKFVLYPNPSHGSFKLEANRLFPDSEYEIRILNTLGQVVQRKKVNTIFDELNTEINISGQSSGVYYMVLFYQGKFQKVEPIVVQP